MDSSAQVPLADVFLAKICDLISRPAVLWNAGAV